MGSSEDRSFSRRFASAAMYSHRSASCSHLALSSSDFAFCGLQSALLRPAVIFADNGIAGAHGRASLSL